jgi:dihydrofolate reductase
MARLICSGIVSLDGYTADADGHFDWSMPDEEVHSFINDLERPIGTYLYGRRLYQVMLAWEDASAFDDQPQFVRDYALLWKAADKIVFSTTLDAASSARTSIQRAFDPAVIGRLKETADRDISVGGADLAGQALRGGLVDELRLFISPVIVGGGKALIPDDVRLNLELLDERRFDNGVVYLRYRVTS